MKKKILSGISVITFAAVMFFGSSFFASDANANVSASNLRVFHGAPEWSCSDTGGNCLPDVIIKPMDY